jgi:hypothetical protein
MSTLKDYLLVGAIIVLLTGIGISRWELYSVTKEFNDLKVKLDIADNHAKEVQKQQEKNTNEIANEINDSVKRVHDYYRMLPRNDKTSNCTSSVSPQASNGQSAESRHGGSSLEEKCTLDALQVIEWQNWAIINKFPIAK